MKVKLYNTLTRKKEPFQTLTPNKVKMYVCGPTVYNYIHIGNARVFVFFDVVRRYLEYLGLQVTYVQNFTDVDDRLIQQSQKENRPVVDIAEDYIEKYFEDMDALGVKRATVHPRATEHIQGMIDAVQALIDKDLAYEVDGDVYFRSLHKEDYGKLSHHSLEELKAGARIEVNDKKEHPLDFALWKAAKPGEVSWETPWGPGRPGWHIECSVMAKEYLGDTLDIHAGGVDLCFPHHENEIAQSESMNGKPFANYWLHNEFINMNNEKMSKSLGNVMTVNELRKLFSPLALRYFLLAASYRHPINFTDEVIKQAENSITRLQTAVENLTHRKKMAQSGSLDPELALKLEQLTETFQNEMSDDFNSANAVTVLFEAIKLANEWVQKPIVSKESLDAIWEWIKLHGGTVLGLIQPKEEQTLADEIEALIEERQEARRSKNFARADEIRNQLQARGIILEDTPQGVRWRQG